MPSLTVIIPTYNEEVYIRQAIHSVRFADEIIVIDSFSTDNTVSIAKAFNCTMVEREFDNFSNQKNHALKYATKEWVLFLDADERITPLLKDEILKTIASPAYEGYKLSFPHFFMNRFLYHHKHSVVRLVRRRNCHFKGSVHEKLIVNGRIGELKHHVLHFTYKGLEHYVSKKDSYAWFQAKQLLTKEKKANYFHLAFKPFYRFFHSAFVKRGILDGVPGLAVSSINAYGVFSRYVKLILLKDSETKKHLLNRFGSEGFDGFTSRQTIQAKQEALLDFKKNKNPRFLHFFSRPLSSFLYHYIIQLGFTKGKKGFILAYLQAFKTLKCYLFLWTRYRNID